MNQLLELLEQLLELLDVELHEHELEELEVELHELELEELEVELHELLEQLLDVEQLDEVELDDVEQLDEQDELDDEQVDTIVDCVTVPPVAEMASPKSIVILEMSNAERMMSDQLNDPIVDTAVLSALVPMLWNAG